MAYDYQQDVIGAQSMLADFGMKVKVGGEKTYAVIISQPEQALGNVTGAGGSVLSAVAGQKVALVPGSLKQVPKVGMLVEADKVIWTITSVDEVNPAGTVVLYKLGVMK